MRENNFETQTFELKKEQKDQLFKGFWSLSPMILKYLESELSSEQHLIKQLKNLFMTQKTVDLNRLTQDSFLFPYAHDSSMEY